MQTEDIFPTLFPVEVRLQAAGDAPIMKQKNYKVDADKKVEWILAFIRKYLKMDQQEQLVSHVIFTLSYLRLY